MSLVLLVDETVVDASPEAVFDLFGQRSDAGWLFGAECETLDVGSVLRFRLPLRAGGGIGTELEATGRVMCAERGRRIVIAHETPWRGRLTCVLTPSDEGTRVRLVAEVDDEGFDWLMRRQGFDVEEEVDPRTEPVGLLVSQSGSASVFSAASENAARLAVEEVNSEGGLRGRPLRLVVADDATDPASGAIAMTRLVEGDGCCVVFANVTSATFRAVQPVAERAGVLLIYPLVNEGGRTGDGVFRLGERPADQLRSSIPWLMRMTGGRRWFLAGNDYCWPKATNRCARRVIGASRGVVVGERYERLGSRRFDAVLEAIERSGAELVVSTFVGADEVAFEQRCHEAGIRERCQTLALALDENTREHVGSAAGDGLWTVFGYFQQLATRANRDFLHRYHTRFGLHAPPVSSLSESVYEAVHLYAAAARAARSRDPLDAGRALSGRSFDGPRGRVVIRNPGDVSQQMFLAQAAPGGFRIVEALGP
jgi:urea transport system substrate-binding protein